MENEKNSKTVKGKKTKQQIPEETRKKEKQETTVEETKEENEEAEKEIKEEIPVLEETDEEIEVKEEAIKEIKKIDSKKETKKPFPWAITVMVVILIIFAGLAISKVFFDDTKKSDWNTDQEKKTIEIKNFYSSECSFCEKENSIIANFKSEERNIPVKVESIDLALEENKHYIEEFGLTMIPTALVNAKELEEYPLQENLIKEAFEEKNEYYVIPESYLDSLPHNLMLLEGQTESQQGKVFVESFSDFQCLGCAIILDSTKKAREDFAGEIIFRNKNYTVHGTESEITAIAAECAGNQNKYFEFSRYLYERAFPQVFDINKEAVDNSTAEVISGATFVSQIPDTNLFYSCIEEKQPLEKINQEKELAKSYGINFAPSLVFDSKYIISGYKESSKIEEIICKIHPELKGCQKETE